MYTLDQETLSKIDSDANKLISQFKRGEREDTIKGWIRIFEERYFAIKYRVPIEGSTTDTDIHICHCIGTEEYQARLSTLQNIVSHGEFDIEDDFKIICFAIRINKQMIIYKYHHRCKIESILYSGTWIAAFDYHRFTHKDIFSAYAASIKKQVGDVDAFDAAIKQKKPEISRTKEKLEELEHQIGIIQSDLYYSKDQKTIKQLNWDLKVRVENMNCAQLRFLELTGEYLKL